MQNLERHECESLSCSRHDDGKPTLAPRSLLADSEGDDSVMWRVGWRQASSAEFYVEDSVAMKPVEMA